MRNIFTEHPKTIGETYQQHMVTALGYGLRMCGAGLACLVHAFLPFLFVTTGSNTIKTMNTELARRAEKNTHNSV